MVQIVLHRHLSVLNYVLYRSYYLYHIKGPVELPLSNALNASMERSISPTDATNITQVDQSKSGSKVFILYNNYYNHKYE